MVMVKITAIVYGYDNTDDYDVWLVNYDVDVLLLLFSMLLYVLIVVLVMVVDLLVIMHVFVLLFVIVSSV